jgi:AcrR family transcriptional regulator
MSETHQESPFTTRVRRMRDRTFAQEIKELQRGRLIAAAIEITELDGYSRLSVARISERSHVSRQAFYGIFSSREDCFVAAFEHTFARAREIATDAYASQQDWRSAMRAAALALLRYVDENPGAARLLIVDALAGSQEVLDRRKLAMKELAHAINSPHDDTQMPRHYRMLTAQAVAQAAVAMLHAHLLEERATPLTEMLGALMGVIVLPYLGRAAACEELETTTPPSLGAGQLGIGEGSNPLNALKLRLTYRTIRVLIAIAEAPGANNRQISRAAGIVDQGQISKLLRRLEALELVENVNSGDAKGRPNAWYLSALGATVQRATGGR